jgi:hypothetical protein
MTHADGAALLAAQVSGEVVPARAQMATTLGFHIILACLGIALPSFVLLAEFIGLRRHDETAMRLARRWSQSMGVLVAVGAVTGTVLSFEMGLLWPGLMRQYGAVLGFPFGVEGLFFFLGAIFAGIYLWGWQRLSGVGALVVWHADRGERYFRRDVGGCRELVDEHPRRVYRTPWPDHVDQSVAGVLPPGGHLRDAAHDPGRLHGHRVRGGLGVRGRYPAQPPGGLGVRGGHSAQPPGPLQLRRVRAGIHPGGNRDPVSDLRR